MTGTVITRRNTSRGVEATLSAMPKTRRGKQCVAVGVKTSQLRVLIFVKGLTRGQRSFARESIHKTLDAKAATVLVSSDLPKN